MKSRQYCNSSIPDIFRFSQLYKVIYLYHKICTWILLLWDQRGPVVDFFPMEVIKSKKYLLFSPHPPFYIVQQEWVRRLNVLRGNGIEEFLYILKRQILIFFNNWPCTGTIMQGKYPCTIFAGAVLKNLWRRTAFWGSAFFFISFLFQSDSYFLQY